MFLTDKSGVFGFKANLFQAWTGSRTGSRKCRGVKAGQCPHFPDRTDGQITGGRDRRSLLRVFLLGVVLADLTACRGKSAATVSLCLLCPDFRMTSR